MATPVQIKCFDCLHFQKVIPTGKERPVFTFLCLAFSGGIPEEIRSWETPHTATRDDQAGDFIFTPKARRIA